MSKLLKLVLVCLVFLGTSAYAQQLNTASHFKNNPDGSQTLLDHVPKEVALGLAAKVSHANSNQMLDLRIILPSQNQTGLNNFIADIYNPKSPNYHKFLNPTQFALMFGPSSVDTSLVIEYLKSQGLTVTKQSKNGLILTVTGPVSRVEPIFKLNINNYKSLDGNIYFAPDANPTIPAQVAGKINAILGMDNTVRFQPHIHRGAPLSVKKTKTAALSTALKGSALIGTKTSANPRISPPASPTGLTATAANDAVMLYWNASPSATEYAVYSSTNSGVYDVNSPLTTVTTTFYADNSVTNNGTPIYYVVAAVGGGGESAYSNEVSATPFGFLGIGGSLGPADIADAYNLNSVTSKGNGQTVGVYELDGYLKSDITAFESFYGISNVTLNNVYTDGFTGTSGANTDEVVLDIDLVMAVAPGLNSIRVYETSDTGIAGLDQWETIVNDPNRPNVISVSWGGYEAEFYYYAFSTYYSELSALGVTIFASAGDAGAYDNCENGTNPPNCTVSGSAATGILSVDYPASDPNVTGVGISLLKVNNAGNSNESYNSEAASLIGGGGVSSVFSIPSFQTNAASHADNPIAMVSTTMRNVPDVVFTADFATTYGIYVTDPTYGAGWYSFWGSSAASPIWAAFLSRVNQGRVAEGLSVLGYLNPTIYQIAQSSDYTNDFHDIRTGINDNYSNFSGNDYYPAESGYDDASGLGSFNGVNLYNELLGPPAPSGLSATPGNQQVLLNWTASTGAVSYNVKRAASSGGSYTTISTSGAVTSANYTNNSLANGTPYYYVVSAVNAGGVEGPNSTQVSATPTPVLTVPSITVQPGNRTVTAPATATFTVVATGTPVPTYQWMESVNSGAYVNVSGGSGATSASYTTPATTLSNSGTQYECVVSNSQGSVTSNAVTLTVNTVPNISTQPTALTVTAPATATFTVVAAGSPTPTYQWMESVNNGAYVNVSGGSGATSASYTTPATTASNNGTQYKCVVTNSAGSVTSNAATLTVDAVPAISTQPSNQTVTAPAAAIFTVVAVGAPAPTYQWMESVNNGSYVNVSGGSGATSASYTTPATILSNSGTQYECVITNGQGSVTSNAATLIVYTLPNISTQPGNQSVTAPATATFTVVAAGTPTPTYQWMESVNNGAYVNVSGGSGAASASYTTGATSFSNNATQYKCVVTNAAGSVTSNVVTLTVVSVPSPPTAVTATASNAQATVSFSGASANGSPITRYTVTSNPSTAPVTGSSSPITVTGLNNYTPYTFTVTATNNIGISSSSAPSNTVTPTPAPIKGVCGTASITYAYSTTNFGSNGLCAVGSPNPASVTFPAAGQAVGWTCQGINGGANSSCSAKQNPRVIFRF